MKNIKKLLILSLIFIIARAPLFAQSTPEENREKIESKAEERLEQRAVRRQLTADQILKKLKERAELKIKEQRRELLLKTKGSVGLSVGAESNPANDSLEKGDQFLEQSFGFAWTPTFSKALSANLGYNLVKQDYFEQGTLSSIDNTFNANLKYYPFESGKLLLEPGVEYDLLRYPFDDTSDTKQVKSSLKFTHYTGWAWHYGGKYEYAYKEYYKKNSRDTAQNELNFHRADYRNTAEIWVKRNIGKYSVKLKGKVYRNNSNDEYQKYYDYDDYTGSIAFSRSFLQDDKLYLSWTPSFERKNYIRRIGGDNTARWDNVLTYRLDAYYTIKKDWTINYSFTHKHSVSNASSGEFTNLTHQLGCTYDF